jgi:transcriptional regulator with GAF, ATPase, and Fis domain
MPMTNRQRDPSRAPDSVAAATVHYLDAAACARLSPIARQLRDRARARWGEERRAEIVGLSPALLTPLERVAKVARYDEPVLILGESGVGKESFAQAVHLLGPRAEQPYVAVNCPQYQEGNLTVSELFGHRKGSFTGSLSDRKGCFEVAEGGVVFLDEIADLHSSAQQMLLRVLSAGEYQPLGSQTSKRADVRVVAATNRSLNQLVITHQFRHDLLFRLRSFLIEIPPLRARGDDWRLLIDHVLDGLHRRYDIVKRFSPASLALLEGYSWPGNVRELIGIVTSGYALSEGTLIQPKDFYDRLEEEHQPAEGRIDDLYRLLGRKDSDFWKLVHEPFMDRDLNRSEVRRLVARGLRETKGNYQRLLELWRVPAGHYQKFMDFLRHHRLKPKDLGGEGSG